MAERRPPGFNVDLGFYDSAEVMSIPRKYRAAAVGVWTLCGAYAAHKMSDGYVSAEALKERGCTPLIRTLLMSTKNSRGLPSPLWVDADEGAIRFTNWKKWQRTAEEIKAYREAEAERKRLEREAKKAARAARVDTTSASREPHVNATCAPREAQDHQDVERTYAPHNDTKPPGTSRNTEMSGRTQTGHPGDVRSESRDPETKTETETKTEKNSAHLTESATDQTGHGAIAATSGADLVREIIPREHPAAIHTALRIHASTMINAGTSREIVRRALELWLTKPNLGPNALPSLVSEVIKTIGGNGRAALAAYDNRLTAYDNRLTAGEAKVAGWANLANPNPHAQEAIES